MENLSSSEQSPEKLYEKALEKAIEITKRYKKWHLGHDPLNNIAEYQEEVTRYRDEMNGGLNERVGLVKEIGIKTIEDVFPKAKIDEEYLEKVKTERELSDEIIALEIEGESENQEEIKDLKNKVGSIEQYRIGLAKKIFFESEFKNKRSDLAEEMGFEVFGIETYLDSEGADFFGIKKGDLQFLMKHSPLPSSWGIGGFSRISLFTVRRENTQGKEMENVMIYTGWWGSAPEDPEIQKEVDRVVAAFG
ncbi:hypothetical protein COB64_00575 [Candidatus Wolfebacteria bacterium]|nr:MAG: hypothetical protein COB64_00575 [Candidatus Wolfebacteria bacterium]